METHVSELRKLAREVAGSISKIRAECDPHVVDLRVFEERARNLATLRTLKDSVNVLASEIRQLTLRAETSHERAVEKVQGHIDRVRKVAPVTPRRGVSVWTASRTAQILGGSAPAKKQWGIATRGAPHTEAPAGKNQEAPVTIRVKLGGGIELDAVKVSGGNPGEILAGVRTSGLHFIPQWGHFAMRVGATVLHGGLGTIYTQGRDRQPLRLLECKRGSACPSLTGNGRSCGYYHDPEKCAGSRDVRNYTDVSWQYVPMATAAHPRGAPRKFGNSRTLRGDLTRMGDGDVRRFYSQTMHDILCALILSKYRA
jgi:hypothetical protein